MPQRRTTDKVHDALEAVDDFGWARASASQTNMRGIGVITIEISHDPVLMDCQIDEELAQVLQQGYDEGGYERAMALAAETLVARSAVEFVPPDWVASLFADAGEAETP